MKQKQCLLWLAGFLAAASAAALEINFDDGVNPFDAGTLSKAHAHSGDTSLRIDAGNRIDFKLPEAIVTAGKTRTIRVTMRVFDTGRWINEENEGASADQIRRGPRWGVSTGGAGKDEFLGANITHAKGVKSAIGYGYNAGGGDGPFDVWFAQLWADSRPKEFLGDGGSHNGESWVPSTEGPGGWSLWIFTMAPDGVTTVQRGNGRIRSATLTPGGMNALFIWGGHPDDAARLGPIYIDDITVTIVP